MTARSARRCASKRPSRGPRRKNRQRARHFELLEARRMLYGVNALESTVDLEMFANNIETTMTGSAFGYAYSVSAGKLGTGNYEVESGSEGVARIVADGELSFDTDTRMEIASVSKPMTAAAILKVLQDEILPTIDPGLDPEEFDEALRNAMSTALDQNAIDYFPATWQQNAGGGVGNISIKDLLVHESGYESYALTYGELEELVVNGVENPIALFFEFDTYTTTNFSFMREMLPFMWDEVDNDILNGDTPTSSLPAGMQQALQDDWSTIEVSQDQLTASLFKYYMQTNIFAPSGIADAGTNNVGDDGDPDTGDETLVYAYTGVSLDTGDQTLKSGGRGFNLSAVDVEKFLTNLRDNDNILRPAVRQLMTDEQLGLQSTSGEFANYLGHNGANMPGPGDYETYPWSRWNETDDLPTSVSQHRVNTRATIFPNDVVASLVINSQIVGGPWDDADITGQDLNGDGTIDDSSGSNEVVVNNGSWKADILTNAYEDALTGFVIDGNDGASSFVVRLDPVDPGELQVLLDDDGVGDEEIVLDRPLSTLRTLTLMGKGGSDTFEILALPDTVSLTIVGGTGDDVITLGGAGTFGWDIEGAINIDGSDDADQLIIDDTLGVSPTYTLTADTFATSQYTEPFVFENVEVFNLTTSSLDSTITVAGVADSVDVEIDAELGDDQVTISDVGLVSNVTVYTGFGNDTVTLVDLGDFSTANLIAPAINPANDNLFVLGGGDVGAIRGDVSVQGGNGTDTLLVDDTAAPNGRDFGFWHSGVREHLSASGTFGSATYEKVELGIVKAGDHDDTFDVQSLSGAVDPNGRVLRVDLELWGGAGDDEFMVAQPSREVAEIKGTVSVFGEAGSVPRNPNEPPQSEGMDTLQVFDQNHNANDHFVISSNGIVGLINKPGFDLEYAQIEDSQLLAGTGNNQFDVESTPLASGPLRIEGREGVDLVRITPTSENQSLLRSELHFDGGPQHDQLTVNDSNSAFSDDYLLNRRHVMREGAADIRYTTIEQLDWRLNNLNNTIHVVSTQTGTDVTVYGNDGDDTLTARRLASNLSFQGGGDDDHALHVGGRLDDHFVVQAAETTLDGGSLNIVDVESRAIHGRRGANHLTVQGTDGTNEAIYIQPHEKRYAGEVVMTPFVPLGYQKIQSMDVVGNETDADSLQVNGAGDPGVWPTVQDKFEIGLSAAGTVDDPVLELQASNGRTRLNLTDYQHIDTLIVDGLLGKDRFNVHVEANLAVPHRSVALHGHALSNDLLNVVYDAELDLVWNEFGLGAGDMEFSPLDDSVLYDLVYHEMNSVVAALE